jgi:flagellar protein FliL
MANEQAPAAPDAAPSKPKLPLLIGMVAVGLAVGGGTGAMFVGPMVAKKMGKAPVVATREKAVSHDEEEADSAEAEHSEEDSAAAKEGTAPPVHLLENLVLNPAGTGGSRFLLLSVAIEVGNGKAAEAFKSRDAELRDIILTSLGTKTVDQLTEITQRDSVKKELQAAINGRFGKKAVKSMYFPQFVVQ